MIYNDIYIHIYIIYIYIYIYRQTTDIEELITIVCDPITRGSI